MRKILSLLAALLLIPVLLTTVSSCKKKNDDTPSPKFTLERIQYYPFEMAQIGTENITLNDSTYSGTLNGNAIELRNYSGQLVFMLPNLTAGDYTVKVLIGDAEYSVPLTVIALPSIPDADVYVQTVMANNDSNYAHITAIADSLEPNDKTAVLNDLQTINNMMNNVYSRYNSLSPTEKEEFARTVAANQWWLDEVQAATNDLVNEVATFKNQALLPDYEAKGNLLMIKFQAAVLKVLLHVPKIAGWAAVGAVVGTIILPGVGTIVGGATAAAYVTVEMIYDMQILFASIDRMMDHAFKPIEDDLAAMKTNDFISFTSMTAKAVTVTTNYRSVYQADANSTAPLISQFVNALINLKTKFATVKTYLPAAFRNPKLVTDVSTYKTKNRPVNSNWLSVSDISNNNVTLESTDKTDGYLKLKFKNNATTTQNFSFKLNYSNPGLGSFSKTIDASVAVQAELDTMITDGIKYFAQRVGNHMWTKANLIAKKFNDGTLIPELDDSIAWKATGGPAWCHYQHDSAKDWTCGKLYNWHVVNSGKNPCAAGWHIATKADFEDLIAAPNYLDAAPLYAGCGFREDYYGAFNGNYWIWTTTLNTNNPGEVYIFGGGVIVGSGIINTAGMYIRCVKD